MGYLFRLVNWVTVLLKKFLQVSGYQSFSSHQLLAKYKGVLALEVSLPPSQSIPFKTPGIIRQLMNDICYFLGQTRCQMEKRQCWQSCTVCVCVSVCRRFFQQFWHQSNRFFSATAFVGCDF